MLLSGDIKGNTIRFDDESSENISTNGVTNGIVSVPLPSSTEAQTQEDVYYDLITIEYEDNYLMTDSEEKNTVSNLVSIEVYRSDNKL